MRVAGYGLLDSGYGIVKGERLKAHGTGRKVGRSLRLRLEAIRESLRGIGTRQMADDGGKINNFRLPHSDFRLQYSVF
jgi:hypothetical protein